MEKILGTPGKVQHNRDKEFREQAKMVMKYPNTEEGNFQGTIALTPDDLPMDRDMFEKVIECCPEHLITDDAFADAFDNPTEDNVMELIKFRDQALIAKGQKQPTWGFIATYFTTREGRRRRREGETSND